MKLNRTVAAVGVTSAFVTLALTLGAASAMAAPSFPGMTDHPTTVETTPGATVAVPWTVKNESLTGFGGVTAQTGSITFTAPTHTTFPAQSTVPAEYSANGSPWAAAALTAANCAVSNAGKTLTCEVTYPSLGWNPNILERFSPQVQLDQDAPLDTALTGSGLLTISSTVAPTGVYDIPGSLNVIARVADTVDTPVIAPSVAGAVLLAGVGVGGGVLVKRRRKSAQA